MVDRGRSRSTGPVNRCARTCTCLIGWRAGRPTQSTTRELCSLEMVPVDRQRVLLSVSSSDRPGGRPAREPLLSSSRPGRPDGRSVAQRHKNDRWPVDRPVDRKGISALSWLPTGRFVLGLYIPHSLANFTKNFKSKIFYLSASF